MYGQTNNKRDFEMAMGSNPMQQHMQPSFMQQQVAGNVNAPPQNNGAFFFPQQIGNGAQMPQQQQIPMGFSPQQLSMAQMAMGGFDPRTMQFLPAQFFAGAIAAPVDAAKQAGPKTDADWALEKRRARNRITAAESRRKCKEEIQNLREELIRLKDEKQEKEDMIEYYRNRYEKYETDPSGEQPISAAATALVGMASTGKKARVEPEEIKTEVKTVEKPISNSDEKTSSAKSDQADDDSVSDLDESESGEK